MGYDLSDTNLGYFTDNLGHLKLVTENEASSTPKPYPDPFARLSCLINIGELEIQLSQVNQYSLYTFDPKKFNCVFSLGSGSKNEKIGGWSWQRL